VEASDKSNRALLHLSSKFPNLSNAKVIKQGIFSGLQITKVMFDENFERKLKFTKLAVWKSLSSLVRGFLINKREEN
jgi:hypothetical protein